MSLDPLLGEIILFGGTFAPRGWADCDGRLLPINQNQSLYSLLGTTYGGDGRTDFGLPDLRGRVPVGPGTGPGLSPVRIGERGGTAANTLTEAQLPAHSHGIAGSTGDQTTNRPSGASSSAGNSYSTDTPDTSMAPTNSTGSGQPVNNMPPYTGIRYIIAIVGVFPSRT
jgi:microcystin-dependent protein